MSSRSNLSQIASTVNTNMTTKVHRAQAPQGAYSRIAQARAIARHNEQVQKVEEIKMKENEKLKDYKLQQQQREKRMAEERIKQAGILNTRIAN